MLVIIIQGLTGQGLLSPFELDDPQSFLGHTLQIPPSQAGRQAANQQQIPVVAVSSIVLPTAFSLAPVLEQAC